MTPFVKKSIFRVKIPIQATNFEACSNGDGSSGCHPWLVWPGGPNGARIPPKWCILTSQGGEKTPKRGYFDPLGGGLRGFWPGRRPSQKPKMTVLRAGRWSGARSWLAGQRVWKTTVWHHRTVPANGTGHTMPRVPCVRGFRVPYQAKSSQNQAKTRPKTAKTRLKPGQNQAKNQAKTRPKTG